MKLKIEIILFVGVIFIAFLLRFYNLSAVPNGLQQDETSIGYNAYSILKTGKDEHGKSYPLYFKAFGEYKLPVSIYMTVPSVHIFGLNAFGVRFPFALIGGLTVVVMYFLASQLPIKNRYFPLIASLLLAINPWHLHFSRGAFEVVPSLFLITLGITLFLKYIKSKSIFVLCGAVVSFTLSIYSYNVTRLLVPLLIIFLVWYFRRELIIKNIKLYIFPTVLALIMFSPFVVSLFSNGGVGNTTGTLLFSSPVTQAKLLEFRSYVNFENTLIAKLIFNKFILSLLEYFKNIVQYINGDFFFSNGSTHGNHGIGNVGQFYLFEIVTIIFGSIFLYKKKLVAIFISWIAFVILVASLTREAPYASRSFAMIPAVIIFSTAGIIHFIDFARKSRLKLVVIFFFAIFSLFNIVYYFSSYYYIFPTKYAMSFKSEDQRLATYISDHNSEFDKVIIDPKSGLVYSSLIFYLNFSPTEFQRSVKRLPDDLEGFSKVTSFSKFQYKSPDWVNDVSPRTLIITTSDSGKPNNTDVIETFIYPVRPLVAVIDGRIIQYPALDNAYVLVKGQ